MTTGEWGIVKSWSRAGRAATAAALQILDNPRICKSEVAHGCSFAIVEGVHRWTFGLAVRVSEHSDALCCRP